MDVVLTFVAGDKKYFIKKYSRLFSCAAEKFGYSGTGIAARAEETHTIERFPLCSSQ